MKSVDAKRSVDGIAAINVLRGIEAGGDLYERSVVPSRAIWSKVVKDERVRVVCTEVEF